MCSLHVSGGYLKDRNKACNRKLRAFHPLSPREEEKRKEEEFQLQSAFRCGGKVVHSKNTCFPLLVLSK